MSLKISVCLLNYVGYAATLNIKIIGGHLGTFLKFVDLALNGPKINIMRVTRNSRVTYNGLCNRFAITDVVFSNKQSLPLFPILSETLPPFMRPV